MIEISPRHASLRRLRTQILVEFRAERPHKAEVCVYRDEDAPAVAAMLGAHRIEPLGPECAPSLSRATPGRR